jgi:predicted RecA/RadA family phage recombinase
MKNFVQPGQFGSTVIAPAGGAVAGAVCHIGAIIGVYACSAAAGAEVEISCEGIFDLNKIVADSLSVGGVAKIDASGNVAAAGVTPIGWVMSAAGSGASTARVRLCPGIGGAGATLLEAPAPEHPQHAAGKKGRE